MKRINQKLTSGAQSGYCVENFEIKDNGVLTVGDISGYENLLSDPNDIPNLAYIDSGLSGTLQGSGTSGYIPKWIGVKTLSDSNFYDTGTKIGLGTINPTVSLENNLYTESLPATTGTSQIAGLRLKPSDGPTVFDVGTAPDGSQWIQAADGGNLANNYPLLLNPNGGDIGIGNLTPTAQLSQKSVAEWESYSAASGYRPIYNIQDSTGATTFEIRVSINTLQNTFVGGYAGSSNTTGEYNSAFGYQALYSNTIQPYNTAFGSNALYSNTDGFANVAVGDFSLFSNIEGIKNTAIGSATLYYNLEGDENTALGADSLYLNEYGSKNTSIGAESLYNNLDGSENTSVGAYSLYLNNAGSYNTSVGSYSLYSNVGGEGQGQYNTAVGAYALFSNEVGNNTAVGFSALYNNVDGLYNNAFGANTLYSNTSGSSNVAVGGAERLYETNLAALYNNITGDYNTAIGLGSLFENTDGFENTGLGFGSLYSNTVGFDNTALGFKSLYSNVDSIYNTAQGAYSLYFNSYGYGNTAQGAYSLYSNLTGNCNTALGGVNNSTTGSSERTWSLSNTSPTSGFATRSIIYKGKLYVGIGRWFGPYANNNSAEIWEFDDATWQNVYNLGLVVPGYCFYSFCIFNDVLYVAFANQSAINTEGYVAYTSNGIDWTTYHLETVTGVNYTMFYSMLTVGSYLYGFFDKIWRSSDGTNWSNLLDLGIGGYAKGQTAVFNGDIYYSSNYRIYKYIIGSASNIMVLNYLPVSAQEGRAMYVWNSKIYFATMDGKLWSSSDGTVWVQNTSVSFTSAIENFFEYEGKLLLTTEHYIYESDNGDDWSLFYTSAESLTVTLSNLNDDLYLGTGGTGTGGPGSDLGKVFVYTAGAEWTHFYAPLYSNTTGSCNTATGTASLYSNTTGSFNTALGSYALFSEEISSYNTGIGAFALYYNLYGPNTAVGYKSLFNNASGYNNTAQGHLSLYSNISGYDNTAQGHNSLYSNTGGYGNTAAGKETLRSNTVGYNNTAQGASGLRSNTAGYCNTAQGVNSLYSNVSGYENTAQGCRSLYGNTSGYGNVGIGADAGRTITTGKENVFVGKAAGYHSNQKVDVVNSIAVGRSAFSWQDNQAVFGNSGTSETILYGQVGVATEAPDPCAAVDLGATDGGLLINRLDSTARDALAPVNGLVIYNITDQQFQQYANGVWVPILSYLSTGIFTFEGLSKNTSNPSINDRFDVGAVEGWIVDNTSDPSAPVIQYVTYPGSLVTDPDGIELTYLTTNPVTYIGLSGNPSAWVIEQQTTPFTSTQQRDIIKLGVIVHSNNTSIVTTNNQTVSIYDAIPQLNDLGNSLGKFNIPLIPIGNNFTVLGGMTVERSEGKMFSLGSNYLSDPKNPHIKTIAAESPVTFRYRLQDSTEYSNTTTVDPDNYDDAGVLTAVSQFKFTVQRAYIFESGLSRWQYGQTEYENMDDAEANIPHDDTFIIETNLKENGLLRAFLIIRQGCTDLTNPLQAKFLPVNRWGLARETVPSQTYRTEIINNLSTGLRLGGGLSGWAGTDSFSVESGCGVMVDNFSDSHYPSFIEIIWDGYSGVIDDLGTVSGNPATHIFIDNSGTIIQLPFADVTQVYKRTHIYLGLLGHSNHTSVTSVFNTPISFVSPLHAIEDLTSAIGLFSLDGNIIASGSVAMQLSKDVGHVYQFGANFQDDPSNPSVIYTGAIDGENTPASLLIYSHGIGFIDPGVFEIDAAQYDPNGLGTLSALGVNKWQIARIWHMASPNFLVFQYGQEEYANYAAALAAVGTETSFIPTPSLSSIAYLSAYLLVRGGASDLTDLSDAKFIPIGKFGGGGGGGGGTGESGYSGISGWSGFSGESAWSGFSGWSGTGESGFSGESGWSGFGGDGDSGFSGESGWSGFGGDGDSGFSGESGWSGFGESGFSGESGWSGESSWSGFSGTSAWSGFSGESGWSGESGYSGSGISGWSGEGISGYSGWSGSGGSISFDELKKWLY